jgi:Protein of unknown function (DUF3574)
MSNPIPVPAAAPSPSPSRRRHVLAASLTALAFTLASPSTALARNRLEPAVAVAADGRAVRCAAPGAQTFARTELFFGLSKPGGVVTEEEFKNFVDLSVTPRFPDGLTLLSGVGQFRDSSGTTIVEGSKVLILLYPARGSGDANRAIEQIRADYKTRFEQQSVLRADDVSCVSF